MSSSDIHEHLYPSSEPHQLPDYLDFSETIRKKRRQELGDNNYKYNIPILDELKRYTARL